MAECLLPKQDVASSSLVSRFFPRSRTQVAKGAVCKTVITGSNPVGSLSLYPLKFKLKSPETYHLSVRIRY